ncbi:MAG: hypothetical protein IT430_01530 [Phycisphaerales bacterium]|nr:hypothetical protein [Phycisphaerales bacterium]
MNEPDPHATRCDAAASAAASWLAAEAAGFDMSLIEDRLRLTVTERFERHEQSRQAVLALRQAGIEYYGFDPRHPA